MKQESQIARKLARLHDELADAIEVRDQSEGDFELYLSRFERVNEITEKIGVLTKTQFDLTKAELESIKATRLDLEDPGSEAGAAS